MTPSRLQMIKLASRVLKYWSKHGLELPAAYDPEKRVSSTRLLWAWLAFLGACISLVELHKRPELLSTTWTAIAFFIVCTVFSMLSRLHSFKADLDDKSLELESGDSQSTEEKKDV